MSRPWPRRAQQGRRGPMWWSHRAWRPAATAVASMRGDRTRGAQTGAVSGSTRSDNRYARCGHQGRRYRKNAGLGGTVSRLGKGGASWGRCSIALGGRPRPPRLIAASSMTAWRMSEAVPARDRRTRYHEALPAVTLEDRGVAGRRPGRFPRFRRRDSMMQGARPSHRCGDSR